MLAHYFLLMFIIHTYYAFKVDLLLLVAISSIVVV